MQPKIYLLLRHNRQLGPFTLEELLQQAPQPQDLIWVEGRSAGWRYPSEVDSLKPFFGPPEPPPPPSVSAHTASSTPPKKVYVTRPEGAAPVKPVQKPASKTPSDPLEQKAEALRQRAFAAETPSVRKESTPETLNTKLSRDLAEVENDYTNWVFQAKTAKKKAINPQQWGLALLGLALVGAAFAWFGSGPDAPAPPKSAPQVSVAQPIVEEDTSTAAPLVEGPIAAVELEPQTLSQERADLQVAVEKTAAGQNRKLVPGPAKSVITTTTPTSQQEPPIRMNEPPASLPNPEASAPAPEETPAVPEKKKRKLGEKIDAFFEKLEGKGKKEETVTSLPPAQEPTGERNATRRGAEETVSPSAAELKTQVQVTGAERNGEWMMGVQGLKLTLHNRSNEAIRSAVVEVVYYNEQKVVLDKKRVSFANIAPRGKVTAAAPDHRLADHAEYQVVSVTP